MDLTPRTNTSTEVVTERAVPIVTCIGCGQPASWRCPDCGIPSWAGPYRVEKVLSEAGDTRTYLARDAQGASWALKEWSVGKALSAEQLSKWLALSETLRALSHPRLPRFAAFFIEGEAETTRLYCAQSHIEGPSLSPATGLAALADGAVVDVARQVLEVLVYLHARQPAVVHGDIKPKNLLQRADRRTVLVDFDVFTAVRQVMEGAAPLPLEDLRALGLTLSALAETGEMPLSPSTSALIQRLVHASSPTGFASANEALAALASPASWPTTGEAWAGLLSDSDEPYSPVPVEFFTKRGSPWANKELEALSGPKMEVVRPTVKVGGAAADPEDLHRTQRVKPGQSSSASLSLEKALLWAPFLLVGAALLLNAATHNALFTDLVALLHR